MLHKQILKLMKIKSSFRLHVTKRNTNNAHACISGILDFHNEKLQRFLESKRQEFYNLRISGAGSQNQNPRKINQLADIVKLLEQCRTLQDQIITKADMDAEQDKDMKQLMEEENEVYTKLLSKTQVKLLDSIDILADDEAYAAVIFEVTAGAGGQEAMLFANELYNMYINYFHHRNWDYEILSQDLTDIGGLRHANLLVHSEEAFENLRYEAGVHRVQRVPATEKSGRMHTSTVSVTVIPKPPDINVHINDGDLKIETKRSSGAGGQHVNTTDSAVRMTHVPTGISVESQNERSQIKNREAALKKLQAKLMHIQLQATQTSIKGTRKAQQGNLDRNEKIRTYNFVQDRITDHRIQAGTLHNLKEFLVGGEHLQRLIEKLVKEKRRQKLVEMIAEWTDDYKDVANVTEK